MPKDMSEMTLHERAGRLRKLAWTNVAFGGLLMVVLCMLIWDPAMLDFQPGQEGVAVIAAGIALAFNFGLVSWYLMKADRLEKRAALENSK